MLRKPVILDDCGSVNVDGWEEVELLVSQHLLVSVVVLHNSLVDELQAQEQRHLHREKLSSMSGTCDKDCVASISVDLSNSLIRFSDVKIAGVNLFISWLLLSEGFWLLFFLFLFLLNWLLFFLLNWLLLLLLLWLFLFLFFFFIFLLLLWLLLLLFFLVLLCQVRDAHVSIILVHIIENVIGLEEVLILEPLVVAQLNHLDSETGPNDVHFGALWNGLEGILLLLLLFPDFPLVVVYQLNVSESIAIIVLLVRLVSKHLHVISLVML